MYFEICMGLAVVLRSSAYVLELSVSICGICLKLLLVRKV